MMRALADTRVLVVARFVAYAAVAAGAATAPDVPKTVALLGPTHPFAHAPAFVDSSSATLGALATAIADATFRVAGFGGLAFGTALALVLTLALIEWRARRAASPPLAFCAALLGAACLLDTVHVGDGAANALCFAALLAAFDLRGPRAIAGAALVTALWCNLSAVGIFAPIFAVIFAMGSILDRAEDARRRRTQLIALGCVIATFATPALFMFAPDAWRAVALDNGVGDVLPAVPAVAAPLGYYVGVVLTIVVALAIGARGARAGDTLVFGFAAICAFAKGELVPFVGIAGAPLLAEAATRAFARPAAGDRGARAFALSCALTATVVALAAGGIAAVRLPTLTQATAAAPYGALARYAREPAHGGRLLCTKLAWCDVAERTYGFDVLADSRVAIAPDATIAAQREIAGAKRGWDARARAFGVDAIFLDARSGFATVLRADGWQPHGTDGSGALFVRPAATR
jgi:hypothetical protein